MTTCVFWIQRLEDARHVWCKPHGSPVLIRVRLAHALECPTTRRQLCLASPFKPQAAQFEGVSWTWDDADRSFAADHLTLLSASSLAPTSAPSQPRPSFGRPMR